MAKKPDIYDIPSEEIMIAHAVSDPSVVFGDNELAFKSLTGERAALCDVLRECAQKRLPVTEGNIKALSKSEEASVLGASILAVVAKSPPDVSLNVACENVLQSAARRKVATASKEAHAASVDGTMGPSTIDLLERACVDARTLMSGRNTNMGGLQHVGETTGLVAELKFRADPANKGKTRGLPFGIRPLEMKIDGLQPKKLYVIGARPSVGKSAMAGQIALQVAHDGHHVLFFSLEMDLVQLQQRFVSALSGVSMTSDILNRNEQTRILSAIREMKALPIHIDDTDASAMSLPLLRQVARRSAGTNGTKLIIVDYLQLLDSGSKTDNKQSDVSKVSAGLKALAKELSVPVLALAQLKRSGQAYTRGGTEESRPTLESLKESGAIEQDADTVILLHRDIMENASEADAIVAKNRGGTLGSIRLTFHNDITKFSEERAHKC